MAIYPETLKALRGGRSQQALADLTGGAVSKRQIARIEAGHTRPERVRYRTIEFLAKALNVTVETLCAPIEPNPEEYLLSRGRKTKIWLSSTSQFYYDMILERYGVSFDDLVAAAPWMFTLLAEISLTERGRRLEDGRMAFEAALEQMPDHLYFASLRREMDEASEAELKSISALDVLGAMLIDPTDSSLPRRGSNPFGDFLAGMVRTLDSDALAELGLFHSPGSMPTWTLFAQQNGELAGGDEDAAYAILAGYARISEIPEDLRGEERARDRAAWLIGRIPPEEREWLAGLKTQSARS